MPSNIDFVPIFLAAPWLLLQISLKLGPFGRIRPERIRAQFLFLLAVKAKQASITDFLDTVINESHILLFKDSKQGNKQLRYSTIIFIASALLCAFRGAISNALNVLHPEYCSTALIALMVAAAFCYGFFFYYDIKFYTTYQRVQVDYITKDDFELRQLDRVKVIVEKERDKEAAHTQSVSSFGPPI